jgi:fructan beta-fructosidase
MNCEIPYNEALRPQFHFTPQKNWTNDPNGLVYYKGEYHLFFQYNPKGLEWGPNTWGHALSLDLVHWRQIEHAIEPDEMGWIWSGSAVVDWQNTGKFRCGDEHTLVAFYTTGDSIAKPEKPCVQCIAYSNDRGRTWTKYAGNPVIGHIRAHNRDPKVIWHGPSQKWVMALFLDGNDYVLLGSQDLRQWTRLSDVCLPGTGECPDFFDLPVDGDPTHRKWVFWGGAGIYQVGTFDGTVFVPETDALRAESGANGYAAQTWSDISPEDGRRIQISWMAGGKYPGMPFNQQMSFPVELTLHTLSEGIRLFRQPVREVDLLHERTHTWKDVALEAGRNLAVDSRCELFDVRAEIELGEASGFGVLVRGLPLVYDVTRKTIRFGDKDAALESVQGRIRLQLLVDRTSLEVFGNDGQVSMSCCFLPEYAAHNLAFYTQGGAARIVSLAVHELHAAWPKLNAG